MDTLKTTPYKVRNNVNIPIASSSQLNKLSTAEKINAYNKAVQVDHRNKKELVDIDNIPKIFTKELPQNLLRIKRNLLLLSAFTIFILWQNIIKDDQVYKLINNISVSYHQLLLALILTSLYLLVTFCFGVYRHWAIYESTDSVRKTIISNLSNDIETLIIKKKGWHARLIYVEIIFAAILGLAAFIFCLNRYLF